MARPIANANTAALSWVEILPIERALPEATGIIDAIHRVAIVGLPQQVGQPVAGVHNLPVGGQPMLGQVSAYPASDRALDTHHSDDGEQSDLDVIPKAHGVSLSQQWPESQRNLQP